MVGPAGESDLELLSTSSLLVHKYGLQRNYFEAFRPVMDTPLEGHPPAGRDRQLRLYQAEFLLRDYGFELDELPLDEAGNLPLDRDPKLLYADHHYRQAPLDINQAEPPELLRIPGIGPRSTQAILRARRSGRLNSLGDLSRLGAVAERAAPYITMNGARPPQQLTLL